jgi:hypothetical protein
MAVVVLYQLWIFARILSPGEQNWVGGFLIQQRKSCFLVYRLLDCLFLLLFQFWELFHQGTRIPRFLDVI